MMQNKKRFEKQDLEKVAAALAKKGEFNSHKVANALKEKGFDVSNRDRVNKLLYDYARNPANKLDSKPSAGIPEHTVYFRVSRDIKVDEKLVQALAEQGPRVESEALLAREFIPLVRKEKHAPRVKLNDKQVFARIDHVADHEELQKMYPGDFWVVSHRKDRRRNVMVVEGSLTESNVRAYYDTSNKVGDFHEVAAWRLKSYGMVLRNEQKRKIAAGK